MNNHERSTLTRPVDYKRSLAHIKHTFINIYKFLRLVPDWQAIARQTSRTSQFQSVKLIHGTLENTCVKCPSRGSPRGTQMPQPPRSNPVALPDLYFDFILLF